MKCPECKTAEIMGKGFRASGVCRECFEILRDEVDVEGSGRVGGSVKSSSGATLRCDAEAGSSDGHDTGESASDRGIGKNAKAIVRKQRWRENNREAYNAYMREYRRRHK